MPITPIIPGEPGNDLAQLINPRLAEIDTSLGDIDAAVQAQKARLDAAHQTYHLYQGVQVYEPIPEGKLVVDTMVILVHQSVAYLYAEVSPTSPITVPTGGDLGNLSICTLRAATISNGPNEPSMNIRAIVTTAGTSGSVGRLASFGIHNNGLITLAALPAAATLASADRMSIAASWVIRDGLVERG